MYAAHRDPERIAAGGSLEVTFAVLSERGERAVNEDAYGYRTTPVGACFVVSDGAGGHAGGAVAARIVVDGVLDAFLAAPAVDTASVLEYIRDAEARLRRARARDSALSDMTATVAVLTIDDAGERALWGHLGDTRVCHFRRGALIATTEDHSVVQRLIDAGLVDPTRASDHPGRNVLYAALGTEGDTPPVVRAAPVAVQDGDAFLLCSDGFWSLVGRPVMERSLRRATSAEEWIDIMHGSLLAATAGDNYTALAVWVGAPDQITVIEV